MVIYGKVHGSDTKKAQISRVGNFWSVRDKKRKKGNQGFVRRRRISNYGLQLREKQKAKFIYGILEKQFRNYYEKALDMDGVTGDNLMVLLEKRLDNVLYRSGMFLSRKQSRQAVNHGPFTVNGTKVNIPSFQVTQGDKISWTERGAKRLYMS
ncbi:MAG: hypothetical protein CM1200mP3_18940 [Chloroflexota bacterium]|nr:MAG: hypothetical protein CM1200mP3_18940 [Chloroflexota bacterium]